MEALKIILLSTFILCVSNTLIHSQISPSRIGTIISEFELRNTDNKIVSLNDFSDERGLIVVFTCNHCPFAKLYTKRFNDLNRKYKALNVPLVAINSMDTLVYDEERFSLMQMKAKKESYNFPYLCDAEQVAGKLFSAEVTPHAYVLWKENNNWVIKYSGAFDSNGAEPDKAAPFVANAVDELLAAKKVMNPETESFGCKIFYRKP